MFVRFTSMAALFLVLVFAACGAPRTEPLLVEPTPVLTSTAPRVPGPTTPARPAGTVVVESTPTATEPTPVPRAARTATPTIPTPAAIPSARQPAGDIPPCAPVEGSSVDPCEPDWSTPGGGGISPYRLNDDGAPNYSLGDHLGGFNDYAVPHIVVRGTYLPNTIRCSGDFTLRWAGYIGPGSHERLEDRPMLHCFADVRVNSYILGSGPTTFTVGILDELLDVQDRAYIEAREAVWERALVSGGYIPPFDDYVAALQGREAVLFLGPADNANVEAWQVYSEANVERRADDAVIVAHPDRNWYSAEDIAANPSAFEWEIPAFTTAVATAQTARTMANSGRTRPGSNFPMLVTGTDQLDQFFTGVGVTDQAQPPPPCGLSVSDQLDNHALMRDCFALLPARDDLRGTGTLNWGTGTAITAWDGVTVAGAPKRVTKLKLENKSLTGTIPAALAGLDALNELKLAGNTLTGCIPLALRDIPSHDLDTLGLLYCQPPAPGGLISTAAENSIALSWDAVTNASKYNVEYREASYWRWSPGSDTLTGTTHTVTGLDCESAYQFRVRAYGDGDAYTEMWGAESAVAPVETATCDPEFGQDSYSFFILDTAAISSAVGSVSRH